MIRMGIIGEGLSEQIFVENVIKPHLLSFGINAFATQIVTKRKASQKNSKGGMPTYRRVKDDIVRMLTEDSSHVITSMFDLYALPVDFPGFKESNKSSNPYEKVELLEGCFAKDIGNKRFVPYIQLYEFEALFFSDVKTTHEVLSLNRPSSSLKDLEKIIRKQPNPEYINDGPHSAPSKRIKHLYPDYQKSVDSLKILQRIGLPKIRTKCDHFNKWLVELESLALK